MRSRAGFTMLELVIVIAIGSVLATIVAATFGGSMDRIAVRSAQTEFLTMHAQARAFAVERGSSVLLSADPATGVVALENGCGGAGAVLRSRNFEDAYTVTMTSGGGTLDLCMTARGYADPDQNSFVATGTLEFTRGEHSSAVVLYPLGQAVRQ